MMKPPKNDPEILALSTDAQAVLAGYWALGKNFTLTMGNQQSRFSERARAAMDELITAGIIRDEKADDGYPESRTYKLTDYGAGLAFRKSLDWIDENAAFSLTESIEDPGCAP